MAKALMGTYTTPRAAQLLDEVRSLRARVAELESELASARATARERATGVADHAGDTASERHDDHAGDHRDDGDVVTLDEPVAATS